LTTAIAEKMSVTGVINTDDIESTIEQAVHKLEQKLEEEKKTLGLLQDQGKATRSITFAKNKEDFESAGLTQEAFVKLNVDPATLEAAEKKLLAMATASANEGTDAGIAKAKRQAELAQSIGEASAFNVEMQTKNLDLQEKIKNKAAAEAKIRTETLKQAFAGTLEYMEQISNKADLQVQLADSLGVGLRASVDMRMQAAQAIEMQIQKEKELLSEMEKQAQEFESQNKTTEANKVRRDMLEIENKITGQKLKQAQMLKTLRDGYVSAITAMTAGSGMFNKILITQDKNMGIGVKYMNVLQSKTSGGVGGGKTDAARFSSNGGIDYGDESNPGYDTWDGRKSNYEPGRDFRDANNILDSRIQLGMNKNNTALGMDSPHVSGAVIENAAGRGGEVQKPGQIEQKVLNKASNGQAIDQLHKRQKELAESKPSANGVPPARQPNDITILQSINSATNSTVDVLKQILAKMTSSGLGPTQSKITPSPSTDTIKPVEFQENVVAPAAENKNERNSIEQNKKSTVIAVSPEETKAKQDLDASKNALEIAEKQRDKFKEDYEKKMQIHQNDLNHANKLRQDGKGPGTFWDGDEWKQSERTRKSSLRELNYAGSAMDAGESVVNEFKKKKLDAEKNYKAISEKRQKEQFAENAKEFIANGIDKIKKTAGEISDWVGFGNKENSVPPATSPNYVDSNESETTETSNPIMHQANERRSSPFTKEAKGLKRYVPPKIDAGNKSHSAFRPKPISNDDRNSMNHWSSEALEKLDHKNDSKAMAKKQNTIPPAQKPTAKSTYGVIARANMTDAKRLENGNYRMEGHNGISVEATPEQYATFRKSYDERYGSLKPGELQKHASEEQATGKMYTGPSSINGKEMVANAKNQGGIEKAKSVYAVAPAKRPERTIASAAPQEFEYAPTSKPVLPASEPRVTQTEGQTQQAQPQGATTVNFGGININVSDLNKFVSVVKEKIDAAMNDAAKQMAGGRGSSLPKSNV
jgi:hypothetical protein